MRFLSSTLSAVVVGLCVLRVVEAVAAPCRLPATGQLQAYGPGSDGDVRAGAALSYTDNGDGTVTDANTGLMWEKKDDSGGIHDKDNVYTWSVDAAYQMDGTIAPFLTALNGDAGFAGYSDWRVPNHKELVSILSLDGPVPLVDGAFHRATCAGCSDVTQASCTCTVGTADGANFYWSSTTAPVYFPARAHGLNFGRAEPGGHDKVNALGHVRAVRTIPGAPCSLPATGQTASFGAGSDGDAPAGLPLSYTDNGDGTVTDENTGLVWEKKNDLSGVHGRFSQFRWSGVFGGEDMSGSVTTEFLAALNAGNGFGGYTDWRLPNIKELTSIFDFDYFSPAVGPAFHQAATCEGCADVTAPACSCTFEGATWSSTTATGNDSDALGLNFFDCSSGGAGKFTERFVRAVRGPSPCGNGTIDAGEECDDGNREDADGCTKACTTCGNGVTTAPEGCDDGNTTSDDGCDANCRATGCGNGVVTAGEQCDDGNALPLDGCVGCVSDPEAETAGGSVGGAFLSVTTDGENGGDGATPSDPFETTLIAPAGTTSGTLAILERGQPPAALPGFVAIGTLVTLSATVVPTPTPSAPLEVRFRLEATRIPAGHDETTIIVSRNGGPLSSCMGAPGQASPDPCVSVRERFPDGDVGLTILTSSLSDWTFAGEICGTGPIVGCEAALPAGSKVAVKVKADSDMLKWSWKSQGAVTLVGLGDPLEASHYTLCGYDAGGRVLRLTAPAAGICAGKPCWKPTKTGFSYKDKERTPDGIVGMTLKSGGAGRAKVVAKALGQLDLSFLPLAPPLVLQLRSVDGACFGAAFSGPVLNQPADFRATSD